MVVRGTNPLHSEKSMWNLVYPRNPRFLHIHSSASVDLTNHPCSSNPRYSRVNWINDLKSNHVSKSPQPLPWTKPRWEQVQELMLPSSVLTLDGLLSTWWSGRSHGTVSQREDQAPVAHPLHLSIRAIPPCSHTLLHPASLLFLTWPPTPARGLSLLFLLCRTFLSQTSSTLTPCPPLGLCPKVTLSGSSRWTPCLNQQLCFSP